MRLVAPPAVFFVLLICQLLAACGSSVHAYRTESILLHGRFAIIESYATSPINPEEVDELLVQVAHILGVRVDPIARKPRIVVTTPDRIGRLHGAGAAGFPGHGHAAALYFPRANLILIPYFDRTLLGHELAHYVSDLYLKIPRAQWEEIAHWVERQLTLRFSARERGGDAPDEWTRR